jgi:hypothetical protein
MYFQDCFGNCAELKEPQDNLNRKHERIHDQGQYEKPDQPLSPGDTRDLFNPANHGWFLTQTDSIVKKKAIPGQPPYRSNSN